MSTPENEQLIDRPDDATLHEHLAAARWFGGKGRDFTIGHVRRLGELGGGRVVLWVVEVRYDDADAGDGDGDGEVEHYQLPLALHDAPVERLEHALVGPVVRADGTQGVAYDAVHDRDATALLLQAFGADGSETPDGLRFVRVPGHDLDLEATGSPFSGEQSNSSVFYGEDAVLKLFRKLTPGENPDIAIHRVLTEADSCHVASLYGWIEHGDVQLGMLQQFLRTASDGWGLALASVRNLFAEADLHAEEVGGDFAAEAARLGEALHEIHAQLRESFPTASVPGHELAATMTDRLRRATSVVPELEEHAAAAEAVFAALGDLGEIATQRVHGDLHLGQTLRTTAAWKLVDFEGEPAKTLAERLLPDSPWRDVAGLTRSFDYAPHAVAASLADDDPDVLLQRAVRAKEWARRNRKAFLAAYCGEGGLSEVDRTILTAYVVDKAVYECVYEARNRPTWLTIPLAGIARLTAG